MTTKHEHTTDDTEDAKKKRAHVKHGDKITVGMMTMDARCAPRAFGQQASAPNCNSNSRRFKVRSPVRPVPVGEYRRSAPEETGHEGGGIPQSMAAISEATT